MLVGLDIGSQSLKAVVAGPDLAIRGSGSVAYEIDYPAPGRAEQDPALWERALAPAIGQALRDAGSAAAEVTALGISGQLDGCVAVDAAGAALGPCLIWMDRRAEALLRALPLGGLRAATGLVPDAGHMAAKAAWLKRHAPYGEDIAGFHQPVSYLVARLTGERVYDHGLASTTMLYALASGDHDPALFATFGLAESELPRLGQAADCAGRLAPSGADLTGLPQGTPVAVGTGDDFANLLGAGLTEPGTLACAIGTGEVVGALHAEAVIDSAALVETHRYPTAHYFLENPGWLSGGAMRWLVETARLGDFAALDALSATAPPGADGLLFLPALSGAMAPEWNAAARGTVYGLTPAHGTGHIGRAMMEGCAYAMYDVLRRLRELGLRIETIRLCGGGARSRPWGQIRADLTGLAVEVPQVVDTAPLGAAALAAVVAGDYPSLGDACDRLFRRAHVLEPNAAHYDRYQDSYAGYRRLFESLKPMFEAPIAAQHCETVDGCGEVRSA